MALIIEKAEPTLTRVELHLSTFISSRNNDLRERQLSEPEKAGGEVKRAKENRFVWHADSEPRRGPERPEETNKRRNGVDPPFTVWRHWNCSETSLPSESYEGVSANCHVICFEAFNSLPIEIAVQNICFRLK